MFVFPGPNNLVRLSSTVLKLSKFNNKLVQPGTCGTEREQRENSETPVNATACTSKGVAFHVLLPPPPPTEI
jgi:hypothetical protein